MVFQIIFLSITWIILAGYSNATDIIFGLISVFITSIISFKMRIKSPLTRLTINGIIYFLWLYYEMLKSCFFMISKIWKISLKDETSIIRNILLTNDKVVNMIITESITFTPGTATVLYDKENYITVHCIDLSLENGVYSIIEKAKQYFDINKDL